jgi:chromosome segregation ATPase
MTERAQVTSVAALESFRAALLVFLTHARASVDEARGDVLRTRLWLENDQTRHWENQLRVRGLVLERAQAEMFGARMSKFGGDVQEKQAAVRRAKQALAEAEEKMKLLKKSERELDHDSEPLLKQVEKLQGFLSGDMGLAVVQLNEFIKALEAYAGVAAPVPRNPEAAA